MMNIAVGSYVIVEINELRCNPRTREYSTKKRRVPRQVVASHGTSFTVKLPDGGLQEIHEQAILEVKAPGWNPESLGPVVIR